tara:strand:+ start:116 stop:343 length:228 start_codon:yes stop_codon:yes gene_type:complete
MKVEIKNELGFECLKYVEEGINVEDAVNILLERFLDNEKQALMEFVKLSKKDYKLVSVEDFKKNLSKKFKPEILN